MAGGGIKINNTSIRGGADGATFIPSVSADGILSWSNDKNYSNPQEVNIKGKDGEDYVLTIADKNEIAQIVIDRLPKYTGGVL